MGIYRRDIFRYGRLPSRVLRHKCLQTFVQSTRQSSLFAPLTGWFPRHDTFYLLLPTCCTCFDLSGYAGESVLRLAQPMLTATGMCPLYWLLRGNSVCNGSIFAGGLSSVGATVMRLIWRQSTLHHHLARTRHGSSIRRRKVRIVPGSFGHCGGALSVRIVVQSI